MSLMTHQPLLGSGVIIYTRQNDPLSQEHEEVQITQGHSLSLLQTTKPRLTIHSTTHNQLQGKAGQGRARQGKAGQGRAGQGRAGLTGKAAHLLSALGMGYVCHILRLAPLGMVMLSSLSQVPVNVQGSFSLSRRNSPDTCNLSQGHTCCHRVTHAVTG